MKIRPASRRPATLKPVIDKIHQEVVAIYAGPAVLDRLDKVGINSVTSTPAIRCLLPQ
jgi:hypothetical protein